MLPVLAIVVSLYCGHMNFVYKDNYYNGTGRGQKLKAISTATERLQDCHHRAWLKTEPQRTLKRH